MSLFLSHVPWLKLMLKEQLSAPSWDRNGKLGAWGSLDQGIQRAGIRPPVAQIRELWLLPCLGLSHASFQYIPYWS